jgi:hypothetical protein
MEQAGAPPSGFLPASAWGNFSRQTINRVGDAFPIPEVALADERCERIADFARTEISDELFELAFNLIGDRRFNNSGATVTESAMAKAGRVGSERGRRSLSCLLRGYSKRARAELRAAAGRIFAHGDTDVRRGVESYGDNSTRG